MEQAAISEDAIRSQVKRLVGELEDLEGQKKALESQIAPKRIELEHWSGILDLRGGTNGIKPSPSSVLAKSYAPIPMESITDAQANEYGAKARCMRQFVLSQKEIGVSMKELVAQAGKLGARSQFAYQFVNRQRKSIPPKLEKRGKKFYATEHMTLD